MQGLGHAQLAIQRLGLQALDIGGGVQEAQPGLVGKAGQGLVQGLGGQCQVDPALFGAVAGGDGVLGLNQQRAAQPGNDGLSQECTAHQGLGPDLCRLLEHTFHDCFPAPFEYVNENDFLLVLTTTISPAGTCNGPAKKIQISAGPPAMAGT